MAKQKKGVLLGSQICLMGNVRYQEFLIKT